MKIAIIDCIGLHYDGTTLSKRGIGGSESAIISISKELVKIGFEVTVFCDCVTADTSPGVYDGVVYQPIGSDTDYDFDIVISQRTVIPFTPKELYDQVKQQPPRDYAWEWFAPFQDKDIHKVVWMQDTFSWGDTLLEKLTVEGYIDEIFNLSDWHVAYTTNCNHGIKRIYEVLKQKIYFTRNAINRWIDEVDINEKDPDLFVYNASITKGMIPLVTKIWPKLKERIPTAKLYIIGGYYDFKDNDNCPYKQQWKNLYQSASNDPSIKFTGIITQKEIAKLVAKASFTIYPGAYPETSGISIIESINYNTPILGTRFGAMNESGTEAAGYYIDYAIEPNSLFPGVPTDAQVDKFVEMCVGAYNNKYLHQQKIYACNAVKDVSTWDTVALQWKQHFYEIFVKDLTLEERKRVDWINYRVQKVFGRRYSNPEEVFTYNKPTSIAPLTYPKVKLAFVDIMGACYDGSTVSKRALGGSEAAVVHNARELAKIGFDVTVYNACDEDDCSPGVYDNVSYKPLSQIANDVQYDVVISTRVATPFVPTSWNLPQTTIRKIDLSQCEGFKQVKLKVLLMHDTFSSDDAKIEKLVVERYIDELWALSDFHYNYLTNNLHGSTYSNMRNYEVLRNHTWITRNGIVAPKDPFGGKKKPLSFVFNANRSKGLKPLLQYVWPRVIEKYPEARLTVIGGYYKLGKAVQNDDEYFDFLRTVGDSSQDPTITFTGILPIEQVYDVYRESSFLLYPTDHPETFSISTLEAQCFGLRVIANQFGALEEIASPSKLLVPYSATPNPLKGDINPELQAQKMLMQVDEADQLGRLNPLLQKEILAVSGWDVVAYEWKQHIFTKLGLYLSASESQQALWSKSQWQKIFGRRVTTPEQWVAPDARDQRKIVVISPFYNVTKDYITKCIYSVAAQRYDNYVHYIINDDSDDGYAGSGDVEDIIDSLPADIRDRFITIHRPQNVGAVRNHIDVIRQETTDDDIVVLLDGDDWLANSSDIFAYYNHIHRKYDFTHGSCWSVVDNIPLISQPYPERIKKARAYREHMFNWYAPYTHLRTFKAKLIRSQPDAKFQDPEGNWLKAGGDLAVFYTAIESCDPDRVFCVPDVVYNYNDANPLNDYKINGEEQTRNARMQIRPNVPQMKKKILIAVPYKTDISAPTFESIYNLQIPSGFTADFQYFYGYSRSQVLNLAVTWAVKYDWFVVVDRNALLEANLLEDLIYKKGPILHESGSYLVVEGEFLKKLQQPVFNKCPDTIQDFVDRHTKK